MFLDKQNTFSDAQAVTASAASTNIIDLGNDDAYVQALNEKGEIEILCNVDTVFATGDSLKVSIQTDDDVAFGSPTTIHETAAVATASLVAGYNFKIKGLPPINEQYIRLYYTVAGSNFTTGKINAGLVLDRQTNGVRL